MTDENRREIWSPFERDGRINGETLISPKREKKAKVFELDVDILDGTRHVSFLREVLRAVGSTPDQQFVFKTTSASKRAFVEGMDAAKKYEKVTGVYLPCSWPLENLVIETIDSEEAPRETRGSGVGDNGRGDVGPGVFEKARVPSSREPGKDYEGFGIG